jgi:hypothetical protein
MASYTARSSRSYGLLLSGAEVMGVESQGLQASQTRCCKEVQIAISEASVNKANKAD